jgi:ACS family allantoate permease-like MFS transporter
MQTAFTALLSIFCLVIGIIGTFRVYLSRENKRRDKEQGVYIDPEPRASPLTLDPDENTLQVDETDWENKSYRYYL